MGNVAAGAGQGAALGGWAGPIGAGIGALGGALTAGFYGQPEQPWTHSRWADPYQGRLFQTQMKNALSGAGDFGFGQSAKQGTSQLAQMMADRGSSPQSGVGLAAQGSMMGNAMAADVGNRRNYLQQMMTMQAPKEYSSRGFKDSGRFLV